jgi:hypothetical protein
VQFDEDETWRLVTVRACERLHITPEQWESMPYAQQCDFLEVWRADSVIEGDRRRNPKAPRNRV